MQKTNLLIRSLLLLILSLVMINTNAQTGLNFQGVARTGNNVILASQAITIKLSILEGSSTGTADYVETRRVITNAQGLFTAVIGDTGAISTLGNFATINWKNTPKFLKIEMDAAGGTDFITMGTTQFQYVAYAQFAKTVDAENIVGIVPVTLGGTGVNSLTGLKTSLAIGNVNNTTDLTKPISTATQTALDLKSNTADVTTSLATKVDKLTGKDLSSNDYTSADKSKLAAITGTNTGDETTATIKTKLGVTTLTGSNTGDQDLSSYATTTALALKANASDLTAGLLLKSNTTDVTTSLSLKENAVNKSTAVDLGGTTPSDVLYPTQKAVKDYVTANNSSGGISDGSVTAIKLADLAVTDAKLATGISKSKVGLANVNNTTDLLKPVSTATQSALDLKSNTADVTTSLATKVDKLTGKDLSSNDYTSADKSKLAAITGTNTGDQTTITGNAATATKLATPKNINGVAFDGSADITITATADAGTLSGMVALANGGTGSTTAAGARTNLGLVIGADVQAPLTAGTNYIVPNASITGATKTKLTYDAKGLVTVGADATTTDIAPSTNRNYVTDAQSGVVSNTSGTNTGDETTSTIKTKLGITTLSGSNTGDQTISLTGDITGSGTGTFTSTIGANKVTNAMLAGSITASKLVGTDITTVGTITSGVWSGTAVSVTKGGTGLTSAGTSGNILTSNGITWVSSASVSAVFLPTIVIGTQQWMEKNLDVLTYRDGTVIPQVTDATVWAGLTTGAWCWYSNSAANGAIYGKLYNWYAVNDSRGLAPQGWHIPTDAEWTTLSTLLGGDAVAGGKMKTTGTTRWTTPNTSATNESGYAGLPGGNRDGLGSFGNVGNYGYWWSATQSPLDNAWSRGLSYSSGTLDRGSDYKENGFSVRCLRD